MATKPELLFQDGEIHIVGQTTLPIKLYNLDGQLLSDPRVSKGLPDKKGKVVELAKVPPGFGTISDKPKLARAISAEEKARKQAELIRKMRAAKGTKPDFVQGRPPSPPSSPFFLPPSPQPQQQQQQLSPQVKFSPEPTRTNPLQPLPVPVPTQTPAKPTFPSRQLSAPAVMSQDPGRQAETERQKVAVPPFMFPPPTPFHQHNFPPPPPILPNLNQPPPSFVRPPMASGQPAKPLTTNQSQQSSQSPNSGPVTPQGNSSPQVQTVPKKEASRDPRLASKAAAQVQAQAQAG